MHPCAQALWRAHGHLLTQVGASKGAPEGINHAEYKAGRHSFVPRELAKSQRTLLGIGSTRIGSLVCAYPP